MLLVTPDLLATTSPFSALLGKLNLLLPRELFKTGHECTVFIPRRLTFPTNVLKSIAISKIPPFTFDFKEIHPTLPPRSYFGSAVSESPRPGLSCFCLKPLSVTSAKVLVGGCKDQRLTLTPRRGSCDRPLVFMSATNFLCISTEKTWTYAVVHGKKTKHAKNRPPVETGDVKWTLSDRSKLQYRYQTVDYALKRRAKDVHNLFCF